MERIFLGSLLRVYLHFVDKVTGDSVPIDLDLIASESIRVVKPDGSEVDSPMLQIADAAAGEAYWQTEDGDVLDQTGDWRIQGAADGYISAPVKFRVSGNP